MLRAVGSSPLSRGIPIGRWEGSVMSGIIPALAGNTATGASTPHRGADHPRSRGEYTSWRGRMRPRPGSSPLSRGILRCSFDRPLQSGIIPALAGNTLAGVVEARGA